MKSVHLWACLAAAAWGGVSPCLADDATPPPAPDHAAILERLAALERRFEALAAENRTLREQLAAAQKTATPEAIPPTPAPAAEPAKPAKPAAVYVAAAGRETKLALGGFMHVNAEFGGAADARWAGTNDRFFIRRARLNLSGAFAHDVSVKLEGDFGNNSIGGRSGYSAQLTDAFLTWTPSDAVAVRAGQFKSPFGYDQLMADTKTMTVERPLASDRLTLSRQIGLGLFGDIVPKRAAYSVGVFNGNGVNVGNNDNDDFLFVGRLDGTVFSGGDEKAPLRIDAGVNAFTMETSGSVLQRDGLGLDLQLTWGPVTLTGEWLRNEFEAADGADYAADGWALFAAWRPHERWILTGRLESYDPSDAASRDATDSWTLGTAYLFNGDHLKLLLNYMHGSHEQTGSESRVLGRLQIMY